MTDIHYFPRYTQPENFVTNNTLLLILRLNQYSRFKFEKFMGLLCEDSDVQLATSWLQFNQQRANTSSVLDGFISQDSVKIAVETKLGPKFNPDQLRRHLEVFGNEQHKLLILLSRDFHFACPATKEYTPECPARHLFRIRSNGKAPFLPRGSSA